MEAIVGMLLAGLIVGGLGRLAVPGPDPMPIWLTIGIGIAGSFLGGGVVAALTGLDDVLLVLAASVVAATAIVIGYRRFVQKRGITGPEAHHLPRRGFGVRKTRKRLGIEQEEDASERLRRLGQLRESGLISEKEFQEKRRELLARL